MNKINLIEIEWNCYNGFIFSLLNLDLNKPCIDSALFGINLAPNFLYIDILFSQLKYLIQMNTEICGGNLKYDGWHLWRCEECGHEFESTGWH
jgi:hypothetical protein